MPRQAAGGGACDLDANHSVCHSHGLGAGGTFFTESDCLITEVGLNVFQHLTNSANDPDAGTTVLSVSFDQFSTCSGFTQVASASGQADGEAVDFQIDQTFDTATLNASVPMTGFGVPDGFTLSVAVTWHGVGDISSHEEIFKFRSPSGHSFTVDSASSRQAIMTGTVTDGTNSYSDTPGNGGMFDSNGKQIEVNKD